MHTHTPITEDLMREHGILNRILLIYETIIDKITHNQPYSAQALLNAVEIIQSFIHGHHERMEEDYIFPLFVKHGQHMQLIEVLITQHIKGREITASLHTFLTSSTADSHATHLKIKHLLQEFIALYRPHEAHEDTDIFPMVQSLVSEKEFKELSEKIEVFEHQLLGKHGVQGIITTLQKIEKELDIQL